MEYVEVGEARIPKLGLGTWQNTGSTCTETVRRALELGYRHIDTAQTYDNERAVGEGIASADVDRSEIFLTTKVRRANLRQSDLHASVRGSLDRLGVEYVDLLLIHRPHPRIPVEETLGAMSELHAEGIVDHLGVSNFSRSQFREAVRVADLPIVTNQLRYHPYTDRPEQREVCVDNDVALTAYSPLAKGAVATDERLARIGRRYDKTAAQVALRWLIQQEGVVPIPKASSRDHLADNVAVFDFSLTEEEMDRIHGHDAALGTRLRLRLQNSVPSVMRRIPDS